MPIFQLKLFFIKNTALKKRISLITLLLCLCIVNAQDNNVKLGIDAGIIVLSDSENIGLFLNFEPKLKISENKIIGLRFGATANSLTFENYQSSEFIINEESNNGVLSFVPTFNYYWNDNKFRPNLGLGIGYYLLVGYLDVSPMSSADVLKGRIKNQVGFLLRGAFELGKIRLGLEYNFIPKADIKIPNGQVIGTVNNSYFGLSIGFTIGGAKSSS